VGGIDAGCRSRSGSVAPTDGSQWVRKAEFGVGDGPGATTDESRGEAAPAEKENAELKGANAIERGIIGSSLPSSTVRSVGDRGIYPRASGWHELSASGTRIGWHGPSDVTC